MNKMRKEDSVCTELKTWFNSYDIDCWLNFGPNSFKTKISQKKPDLIIYSKRLNQYIAIEVKIGNKSRDIYDSMKIVGYHKNYALGKIKYYIEDKEINISSFTVASLYSMFGRLFENEKDIYHYTESNKEDDGWHNSNKKYGLEPQWEYTKTKQFLRQVWSNWRQYRKREYAPGMGIILSNSLNKNKFVGNIDRPLLFDMQWETLCKKPQWRSRQKLL